MPDDLDRVFWRSRRGLLELDLLLMPFTRHCYSELSPKDRLLYCQLLDLEDVELSAWLNNRERPSQPELASIVNQILAYARTNRTEN